MNWRCAIGMHDWKYSKADERLETIDCQGTVRRVVIKAVGRGNTRMCLRCDKRQAARRVADAEGHPCWQWVTLPSHKAVLAKYPKDQVEIHE